MAYITFVDKESADRAVKLSGGEFMKRNLTIQKKRNNKPGVTQKKKLTYL
jgi:RNA recognition motif-containing protein